MSDRDAERDASDASDASDTDGESASASDTPQPHALVVSAESARRDWQSGTDGVIARHWRASLTRWLLTLNPGRTQDEYEKAVHYFFETPGAPQDLAALTPDLLLAYRGSLANRADRRRRSVPRRKTSFADRIAPQSGPLWASAASATLGAAGGASAGASGAAQASPTGALPASLRKGPLSPATVNIRLTALRQFLVFANEQEPLPLLSTERIRSALRRLTNERRRPYQILAEEEWDAFLRAALGSGERAASAPPSAPAPASEAAAPLSRSPWGKTRAEREQERRASVNEAAPGETDSIAAEAGAESPHEARVTGATRTGLYTAQRDHALISLALATGLRAIELSLLDVGDLVGERRRGRLEWWLVLPDEKTKGQRGGRTLPLAPELSDTLRAYIQATGRNWEDARDRATPLFLALARGRFPGAAMRSGSAGQEVANPRQRPAPSYRRLRPEQIRGVIHRVERQWLARRESDPQAEGDDSALSATALAGRHLSPHALRHSAAIALLLGDEQNERPPASVEHVRGWLGHFDIRTTQRYLAHIESRDQRRRFAIRPPGARRGDDSGVQGEPPSAAPGGDR